MRTIYISIVILFLLTACGLQTAPVNTSTPAATATPLPTLTPSPVPSPTPNPADLVGAACQGQPIPEAAPFDPQSKAIHPIVMVSDTGGNHAWNEALPEDWRASSLDQVELVACLGEQKTTISLSCPYTAGKTVNYNTYQLDYFVVVAKTGEKLRMEYNPYSASELDQRIMGAPPSELSWLGECKEIETFAEGKDIKEYFGGEIDSSSIVSAIYPYVAMESTSHVWIGHEGGAAGVAFSPDGKHLLTSGNDHKIVIWNPSSGEEITSFQVEGDVFLSTSPDGKLAATTNFFESDMVNLWDVDTGEKIIALKSDAGYITAMDISNNQVAAATKKKEILVWDIVSGEVAQRIPNPSPKNEFDFIPDIQFSPQGDLLAYYEANLSSESTIQKALIWDITSSKLLYTAELQSRTVGLPFIGFDFSPDGKFFAMNSSGGFSIWETGDWTQTMSQAQGGIYDITFSPDGKWIALPGDNGPVIWDPSDKTRSFSFTGLHNETVSKIDFAPDGNNIASIAWDGSIAVWNISWIK